MKTIEKSLSCFSGAGDPFHEMSLEWSCIGFQYNFLGKYNIAWWSNEQLEYLMIAGLSMLVKQDILLKPFFCISKL